MKWVLLVFALLLSHSRGISVDQCRQKAVQKELYRSLHRIIEENAVSPTEKSTTNVELLALGAPLAYDDFNPGKPSRFEQPGTLPASVLENGLPYVDRIYPTGSYRFRLLSNLSTNPKDYLFDSFSSTYSYILTHMMLLPRNFSDQDVLRAKYYLQELVPNPELVLRNETELPRFMLYDYYRSDYLRLKELKDVAIDTNRTYLTQLKFELWGQKRLPTLESDSEAAYLKWQAFGYKSEVEKQLQYFDIDTHEDKLMSKRALFESMGRPSERNAHVTIFPFKLEPADWFKRLKVDLPESSDELRYKQSLLQAKQALLNATNLELSSKTSDDIRNIRREIERSRDNLKELIKNGVENLLQMEVECFTRVNLSLCEMIVEGHVAFKSLLQDLAEHFAQVEYLESILNGGPQLLKVIQEKLSRLDSELKALKLQINKAEKSEAAENIDASMRVDIKKVSCPETGQLRFTFNSDDFDTTEECEDSESATDTCIDVEVPVNATKMDLWNVRSCFVDSDLETFGLYGRFVKMMNSIPMKISASLLKVDVQRSWFDLSIFDDSEHYTMKRDSGVVSPGPLTPRAYFQRVAHSGNYLLPHYVSSFILATNVSFYFPGLGSWNYSKYDNETNEVINILMKYAYAPVLSGGIGPFSFELPTDDEEHNYQLKRKNGGLLLSLPGGQIIGYILQTVPKFPENQTEPSLNVSQCDETLVGQPARSLRRKRSALDSDAPGDNKAYRIRELAKTLFAEGLTPPPPRDHLELIKDSEVITSEYIDELIKSGDMKKEKLAKFVQSFDKKPNPAGYVNSTADEFAYND